MIWTFLLILAGGLLAVVGACLALPLHFRLRAESLPNLRLRVEARAMAAMAPAITLFDSARPRKPRRKPGKGTASPVSGKRNEADRGRKDRGRMFRAIPRLFRDLVALVSLVRLDGHARVGLEDPADTGRIFGLAQPVLRGSAFGRWFTVVPEFSGPVFDMRVEAEIAVTPIRLLPPAARFAWHAFGPGGAAR